MGACVGAQVTLSSVDAALIEIGQNNSPSVDYGMERYAGLRFDPDYVSALFDYVRREFSGEVGDYFDQRPSEEVPLGRISDSNQHGFSRCVLVQLLKAPHFNPAPIRVFRDGVRITVWDGSHRYAAARLRGEKTIGCRVLPCALPG